MRQGYLSQYFDGVAVKRLSAVEADVECSNQHEFNGVADLKAILGEPKGKTSFPSVFLYLSDEDEPLSEDGFMTWYDARQKAREERGVMRWEYRLYFPNNRVSRLAKEGDLLVIAKCRCDSLLAIIVPRGSTVERQILWLFDFQDKVQPGFSVKLDLESDHDKIGYAARLVLEKIGIEVQDDASKLLDGMLATFGESFPRANVFSAYARSTLPDVSGRDNPDASLVAWMEREEVLFRAFEKYLLGQQVSQLVKSGVEDPEPFIQCVQSTLQRRKSRAGSALENHLEKVFAEHGVTYTRGGKTEGNSRPDFTFPGIRCYHDIQFPVDRLSMLAAKTTCKDRWRQILNEAARISLKHLLTLEPGISENQTSEMRAARVQLVLPESLHSTYTNKQRSWLMSVDNFIGYVKAKQ